MEELFKLLNSFKDSTGDFACSGFLPELCLPGLVVENVGHISLPVQDEQAQKIIEVAKKAPFGLGAKTVVDETVRKTWQLDPSQITIKNAHFLAGVEKVVSTVKKQLGCDKKSVEANLYKVLLYEKGGHFKTHRDTEKEKGMFATMVIQLPSKFDGGKITVRHAGKEKIVEMDGERSGYCCKYAAHYSDCEHQVSEITNGYRLALVYSLCWTARGSPPSADTGAAIIREIAKILPEVCTGERNLFSWFLSHKYSKAGILRSGIDGLKGADAAVATALRQANELLPEDQQFEFYIAEVSRELQQFGDFWDENSWSGGFQPSGDEEEEVHIVNCFEFDGKPSNLEIHKGITLDIESEVVNFQQPRNVSIEDAIQQFWGEPDSEDNTGPTGNEGAIQTYWYKCYAIFAWQKDNEVNQRCKLNGYLAAVNWISKKLKKLEKENSSGPEYGNAMSELKMLIDCTFSKKVSLSSSAVYTMLETFSSLRCDAVLLANQFITDVMGKAITETASPYCLGDDDIIPPLVNLTVQLGWPSLSESLKKLLDLSPVSQYGIWAGFLQSLFQRNAKKVLQKDASFNAMVTCLVKRVEVDAQNNQLESADTRNSVDAIASLLFVIGDADNLTKFTGAIRVYCEKSPKGSLLKNLICFLEKEKLGENQFWNQLLSLRIGQLEDVEKVGVPAFTWNQDNAVLNDHPAVQAFLRGPHKTMKYQAFKGIAQARKFAETHFGWAWSSVREARGYTAKALPTGTGRHALVVIEKTTEWYDQKVAPIKLQLEELKKLRSMVNPESASVSEAGAPEPQAKKRAVDALCVD